MPSPTLTPASAERSADTVRNIRVQDRYYELRKKAKHGHYETMFRVVKEEVAEAEAQAVKAEAERDEALAQLNETWSDGDTTWRRPTAWAYAQACKVVNGRQLSAETQRDAMAEALTPSAETKGAYIGEVHTSLTFWDPNEGERTINFDLSWTAIKDVMRLVRSRAALATQPATSDADSTPPICDAKNTRKYDRASRSADALRLAKLRRIIAVWFANSWSDTTAAEWRQLSGKQHFHPSAALDLIRDVLAEDGR